MLSKTGIHIHQLEFDDGMQIEVKNEISNDMFEIIYLKIKTGHKQILHHL